MEQNPLELENMVIGCLILEQQTAREYVNKLKPEYFCEEDNRLIHRTIRDLVNQDREVDVFIIAAQLKKAGMQKELQEIAYLLTSRTEVVASSAHMEYYVEELRLFALRRKLNGLALRLQKDSMDLTLEADALVETYETALQNLQAERPWEEVFRTQWQVASEAFLQREQALARAGQDGVTGVHTGIPGLDHITGGWQPNELIVIGGQNGHGKSWLMIHHLLAAAMHGHSSLVYSLEMASEDLYARELMSRADISGFTWYLKAFTTEQQQAVNGVRTQLDSLPITYMDSNEYDIDRLCSMAREQHRKGKCDILFIDYAQIIRASEKFRYEKRVEVVTDFTQKLKGLAKRLHIPVVVLAQLNRQQIKNPDGRPQKSDLRESGSLEQDADKIFLIWRPYLHGIMEYKGRDTRNMLVYLEPKDRKFGEHEFVLYSNDNFTSFSE